MRGANGGVFMCETAHQKTHGMKQRVIMEWLDRRNEPLDIRNYASAALEIIKLNTQEKFSHGAKKRKNNMRWRQRAKARKMGLRAWQRINRTK